MSVTVVAALAGAVFAAVGAGVLVGRSIRTPRVDLPAWACTLAALAVALGAQGYGAYRGYGSGTFRAEQFGAQLIAPLWLAWGLAELTAKSGATRFGAKLVTMALTVVTGVVLITDPLSGAAFGKSWPAASAHYQIIPRSLLSFIAAITVAAVVIALVSALLRARNDPDWRAALIPVAAAGAAAVLILGLRLTLPSAGYPALCIGCAALTWFAGVWAGKIGLAELHGARPAGQAARARRPARAAPAPAMAGPPATGDDFDDDYREPEPPRDGSRSGDRFAVDDWFRPAGPDQRVSEYPERGSEYPERGYGYNGGSMMNGYHEQPDEYEPDDAGASPAELGPAAQLGNDVRFGLRRNGAPGGAAVPGGASAPGGVSAPGGAPGYDGAAGFGEAPARGGYDGAAGFGEPPARGGFAAPPEVPATDWGGPPGRGAAGSARYQAPMPAPAEAAVAGVEDLDQEATQRLYGLIAIYTLAEGTVAEFDALAERVVEDVRTAEPDALVYAVHSVPNADMQRIFYEVYRDRMAHEDHKRQPHILRFEADRAPYVLATNVIELGMQQAKLAPPPGLSPLFGG